jgi:hypothetical protein
MRDPFLRLSSIGDKIGARNGGRCGATIGAERPQEILGNQ